MIKVQKTLEYRIGSAPYGCAILCGPHLDLNGIPLNNMENWKQLKGILRKGFTVGNKYSNA